jgi:predicted glycogen debranching enzyme
MTDIVGSIRIGPAGCTDPTVGITSEWLLTDGLGGYAMGTASGLRTRRYHGLLVVATHGGEPVTRPGNVSERHLALAALDPVLTVGGVVTRLATDEWAGGVIDPDGARLLAGVEVRPGSVVHRWSVGDVVIERELAMLRGRPVVAVRHRVVRAPGPVELELTALGTWRSAHGDRDGSGPEPQVVHHPDGATVEDRWQVAGPGFTPAGAWYRGVRYRQEAARGLRDTEDLWHLGSFRARLEPGASLDVLAWSGHLPAVPPPVPQVIEDAQDRAGALLTAAGLPQAPDGTTRDAVLRRLTVAADHHITSAPGVVAGYPWFGEWSRDTMTSYQGLFLATGRVREGAALLRRYADTVSDGMLANTADSGTAEYNTVDATLWFVHALGRHLAATDDRSLATDLAPVLRSILAEHLAGTRFGIVVDPSDSLLQCGVAGDPTQDDHVALTWMDALVTGIAVTPRHGKPVEVCALWVNALAVIVRVLEAAGAPAEEIDAVRSLRKQARESFLRRFALPGGGLRDVVDAPGPAGIPQDDDTLRPNQLLAASLPDGPLAGDVEAAAGIVRAVAPLVTPLGLRTLAPGTPGYRGAHRGTGEQRDLAYHQGTVWPWLIGPYADAVRAAGGAADDRPTDQLTDQVEGLLTGLVGHLDEAGLGSVSETADGDPPHRTTGCPFQAWSVAELLRLTKALPH